MHQTARSLPTEAALLKQAFALLNRGQAREAAALARQLLMANPRLVQAHFLMGLIALELQDRQVAQQAFGSVTSLQPEHAAAWAQLAKLLVEEGQIDRAENALKQAEQHGTHDPLVQDLMGVVYTRMGDHLLARRLHEQAVAGAPDNTAFTMNLAANRVYHGELDDGAALYRQVIGQIAGHPQAHWSLAGAQKAKDDTHIREMRGLLDNPRLTERGQAFMHYAIGKECEDLKDWAGAWAAFEAGAKARRNTVAYDEAAEAEMFAYLTELAETDDLAPADGIATGAPIFVLGQPRTGTTLIERIITSHSQVTSAGELQQFGLMMRWLADYRDPKRFSKALFEASRQLDFARLGQGYMDATRRAQGSTPRFVDKLPLNYLLIPFILRALPNAKIVHLVRDPMDACFASFKQLFADAYLHSYDQQEMARHHARYYRLMETYRRCYPGRFFDISYEATARDLEPNARALLDYLALPFEPACLEFHRQDSTVATASAAQVREPAHTRSIGRWRQYEVQLQPMLQTLRAENIPVQGA